MKFPFGGVCGLSSRAYLLRLTKGFENCTVGDAGKYNTTGSSLNKSHTRFQNSQLFISVYLLLLLFSLALYIIAKPETIAISSFQFLGD